MTLSHVAGQNENSLPKTECKNDQKFHSYAPFIFGRHLGHQTPSWTPDAILDTRRYLEPDKKKSSKKYF
jgi:hypothetical protein